MKKIGLIIFCLIGHRLFSLVTLTHNSTDKAAKENIDFSLTADVIDSFDENNDDFNRTAILQPYAPTTPVEKVKLPDTPLENKLKPVVIDEANTLFPKTNVAADDFQLFDEAVNGPSNPAEFQNDNFNLFSRRSSQLSYLPQDFNLKPNLFHVGPQFMSVIDYYIDNYFLTPGERYITNNDNFQVTIVRKNQQSVFGNVNLQPIAFTVTCPNDRRVEFDVSEFDQIPLYATNTRAKGCVISMVTAPGWYKAPSS